MTLQLKQTDYTEEQKKKKKHIAVAYLKSYLNPMKTVWCDLKHVFNSYFPPRVPSLFLYDTVGPAVLPSSIQFNSVQFNKTLFVHKGRCKSTNINTIT